MDIPNLLNIEVMQHLQNYIICFKVVYKVLQPCNTLENLANPWLFQACSNLVAASQITPAIYIAR